MVEDIQCKILVTMLPKSILLASAVESSDGQTDWYVCRPRDDAAVLAKPRSVSHVLRGGLRARCCLLCCPGVLPGGTTRRVALWELRRPTWRRHVRDGCHKGRGSRLLQCKQQCFFDTRKKVYLKSANMTSALNMLPQVSLVTVQYQTSLKQFL